MDNRRTTTIMICTLALLALLQVPEAAHNKRHKAACADVKQKIRALESRMRAGYTPAQGERYRKRLRQLHEKRFRTCR